jgi:hypothetical protein
MYVGSDGKGGSLLTWQHYFNWRESLMRYMAAIMLPMMMNTALKNIRKELGGAGGKMLMVNCREVSTCQGKSCK